MWQDILKQLDKNKNQEISLNEIKNFSRTEENIQLLTKELQKEDNYIKSTLESNLYNWYKDLSKKKNLSPNEQLIIKLYQKMFENKLTEKPNLTRVEYNINTEFNNMINWIKSAYPNEYNTLIENQTKKYSQKSEWEKNEYIKYDTIVRAIGKYQEELQTENNILLKKNWFYEQSEIVLDPKIGKKTQVEIYWWWEYFTCSQFFDWISANQYPEYQNDQTILSSYNKEVAKILKQFWYKNTDDFQKDSQIYKKYAQETSKLSKEYKYEESIKYLKEHDSPEDDSQEKIKEYFDHVEVTVKYSEAHDTLSQKYDKNTILKYQNTINEINKTQTKYPTFLDAMQRLSTYTKALNQKKSELHITDSLLTKYSTYVQEVANSWIQKRSERLTKMKTLLENEIKGSSNNAFIFPNIKKALTEQLKKQEQIDKIWNAIKVVPEVYTVANFLVGAWNGAVDATISVWTWLGVLIMSAYKDEHQLLAQSDRAQKRNNFLKIGQSTAQKEPPVKDGKWNLTFDNGAAQLWSSVTNMLILLSGAGAIAKGTVTWWLKLGINISQQLSTKAGLFTRATMQGLPSSFQEGLQQWLDKSTAWNYAMTQTLVSSSLEMIAPNDMFFWNASVKSVLKQLGKEQWSKTLAKAFAKNLSKEMWEEMLQESLQLGAERVINKFTNDSTGSQFEASMTWSDFGTTAVLTALTTGIVSSNGSYDRAKLDINKPRLKQWIVSDEVRFNEYKQKLNQIINGKENMPITIEEANKVLYELENFSNPIINTLDKNPFANYIKEITGKKIDEKLMDTKTIEVISKLKSITDKFPNKKGEIKWVVEKYIEKIQLIEDYLNKDEYKNNPVKLLCDVKWIDYSKIDPNNFIIKKQWSNIIFIAKTSLDFFMIDHPEIKKEDLKFIDENTYENKITGEKLRINWGCSIPNSKIPWLESTLCLINWEKFQNKSIEELFNQPIAIHETRHNFNDILFPDNRWESNFMDKSLFPEISVSPEFLAKQEMIAFLSDWSSFNTILMKWLEKSEKSSYNYFKNVKEILWEKAYDDQLESYQKWFVKNVKIMKMVQENNKSDYLNILSITPIKNWESLLNPEQQIEIKSWETNPKEIENFNNFFKNSPKDEWEIIFTNEENQILMQNKESLFAVIQNIKEVNLNTVIFVEGDNNINQKLRKYISWKNDLANFTGENLWELLQKEFSNMQSKAIENKYETLNWIEMPSYISENVVQTIQKNFNRNKDFLRNIHKSRDIWSIKEYRERIEQEKQIVVSLVDELVISLEQKESITESTITEIIREIFPKIKDMDGGVQLSILKTIHQYITNIINIEKYLSMPEYKNNPKKLLCDIRGVKYESIEWNVVVKRQGANLVFYIVDKIDFLKIYNSNDELFYDENEKIYKNNLWKKIDEVWWFLSYSSEIKELEKTLVVVNWIKTQKDRGEQEVIEEVTKHELRHGLNAFLIQEISETHEKDEIIAYSTGKKNSYKDIVQTLTDPKWIYTYDLKEETLEWETHVNNIKIATKIALDLKLAKIPNYLNILAITPMSQRPKLHEKYYQQIQEIHTIFDELWFEVEERYQYSDIPIKELKNWIEVMKICDIDLSYIKRYKLEDSILNKIKELHETWYKISSYEIKNLLTIDEDIINKAFSDNKIKLLVDLWFEFFMNNEESIIKLSELSIDDIETVIQKKKIQEIQKLSIDLTLKDIIEIKNLDSSLIKRAWENKIDILKESRCNFLLKDLEFLSKTTREEIISGLEKSSLLSWLKILVEGSSAKTRALKVLSKIDKWLFDKICNYRKENIQDTYISFDSLIKQILEKDTILGQEINKLNYK